MYTKYTINIICILHFDCVIFSNLQAKSWHVTWSVTFGASNLLSWRTGEKRLTEMWWCCVQSQLEDWSTHNRFIFYYKIALFSIYVNMHTCTFVHMCACVSACACVFGKGCQIPRSWSFRWLWATWHAGKWTQVLSMCSKIF